MCTWVSLPLHVCQETAGYSLQMHNFYLCVNYSPHRCEWHWCSHVTLDKKVNKHVSQNAKLFLNLRFLFLTCTDCVDWIYLYFSVVFFVVVFQACIWPHCDSCPPTYRGSPAHVFGLDGVLNALHLLLVAISVASCVLFGLLQSGLQGFDPVSGGPQSLLHFRNLAAKVGVVP